MINMTHAPRDRRRHLVEGGVRVPRVEPHAARGASARERLGSGQLRGDGRESDGFGVGEILVELIFLRRSECFGGVASAGVRGEVGAVKVGAQNASDFAPFPLPPALWGERVRRLGLCTASETQ